MVGVLDFRPRDGVIEIEAGLSLAELRAALESEGERLPYVAVPGFAAETDLIGDIVLAGAPHPAEGRFGGWREWILGARVRLPDGLVGFVGSRVVKSVAGYDLHRALVGSGGEFGRFETLVLRTFAARHIGDGPAKTEPAAWITRVLPSNFAELADHPDVIAADPERATLWWRAGSEPARTDEDLIWPRIGGAKGDAAWFEGRLRAALSGSAP